MIRHGGRDVESVAVAHADVLFAALALYAACFVRDHVLTRVSTLWGDTSDLLPRYSLLLLATLPILIGSLYLCGAYRLSESARSAQTAGAVGRSLVVSSFAVLALAFVLRDQLFSRAIIVQYLVLSHVGFLGARLVFISISRLRGQRVGVPRAVIVGTGAEAQAIGDALRRRGRLDYEVVGWVDVPFERGRDAALPTLGVVDDLPELADRLVVDTVLFGTTLEESARLERTIWQLQEVGKTVHLRGDALGGLLSRTLVGDLDGIPMFTLTSVPMDRVALGVKRAIDLAGSSVGLVLLSPFLLGVAGLVKLTSAGPVLHRQERLGLNARRFEMLKFRSMYDGAEAHRADLAAANEMSGPVFKMRNDPRVTPLGRWLRRYSIDELPQLWNVLRGQMSLVGPRPPLGPEVALYERWQRRRLSMKPGLTCLWQVNGRSELDFDTWMKLDLEYIDNWSLGLDLKILLKTIPVVLTARGAR
jgi:exopolysaccharide biosynthesis polyprenyl glycosylphosphotransferase